MYSSFSLTIDLRASAVSIAHVFFESPGRGPAVSLNTSGIARSFISLAAVLPYREYEQVSALFLYDPAILSFEQKSVSLSHFFSLCSAARLTEQRIIDCLALVSNYGSRPI